MTWFLYANLKQYNTSCGDLVPLILANVLNINITIVMKSGDDLVQLYVECNHSNPSGDVLLYKENDHYDAIIPLHSYNCSKYESVDNEYSTDCMPRNSVFNMAISTPGTCDQSLHEMLNPECNGKSGVQEEVRASTKAVSDDIHVSAIQVLINHDDFTLINDPNRAIDHIKICAWNIEGLTDEKLTNELIGRFLQNFDLILVTETWCYSDDNFDLKGYTY